MHRQGRLVEHHISSSSNGSQQLRSRLSSPIPTSRIKKNTSTPNPISRKARNPSKSRPDPAQKTSTAPIRVTLTEIERDADMPQVLVDGIP